MSFLRRSIAVFVVVGLGFLSRGMAGEMPGNTPSVAFAARQVRVAAISFVPVKLDLQGNANRLKQAFRKAAAGGAKLAVAPEGILEGYVINEVLAERIPVARMRDVALPIDDPLIQRFQALAKSLELSVVFGFAERIVTDVYNTALFIDDTGTIRGKYH